VGNPLNLGGTRPPRFDLLGGDRRRGPLYPRPFSAKPSFCCALSRSALPFVLVPMVLVVMNVAYTLSALSRRCGV